MGRCCSEDQFKTRSVKCSARTSVGVEMDLPDQACSAHSKPPTTATCQRTDCPQWNVSGWSECSAPNPPDCGRRIRTVRCMVGGAETEGCCKDQPLGAQACLPCGKCTQGHSKCPAGVMVDGMVKGKDGNQFMKAKYHMVLNLFFYQFSVFLMLKWWFV